jgi:hypothetical protein
MLGDIGSFFKSPGAGCLLLRAKQTLQLSGLMSADDLKPMTWMAPAHGQFLGTENA